MDRGRRDPALRAGDAISLDDAAKVLGVDASTLWRTPKSNDVVVDSTSPCHRIFTLLRSTSLLRPGSLGLRLEWAEPEAVLETQSPVMRQAGTGCCAWPPPTPSCCSAARTAPASLSSRARCMAAARGGRPFVIVSCPTLPSELLTSELFALAQAEEIRGVT